MIVYVFPIKTLQSRQIDAEGKGLKADLFNGYDCRLHDNQLSFDSEFRLMNYPENHAINLDALSTHACLLSGLIHDFI
ncbi:MAG: hypothetical protein ACXABV_09975 [Candidatus Thorarchaeota archaeon]